MNRTNSITVFFSIWSSATSSAIGYCDALAVESVAVLALLGVGGVIFSTDSITDWRLTGRYKFRLAIAGVDGLDGSLLLTY